MCFIFHKWTKWEDRDRGQIAHRITKDLMGTYIEQERRCEKCNKVELREERSWL